eukprot:s529_g9.t2
MYRSVVSFPNFDESRPRSVWVPKWYGGVSSPSADQRGNLCRTAEKPSAGDRTHRMEDVLVATLTVQNSHSMFQVTFEFGECTLQTQMMDHMSTLLNNFAETRLAEMM